MARDFTWETRQASLIYFLISSKNHGQYVNWSINKWINESKMYCIYTNKMKSCWHGCSPSCPLWWIKDWMFWIQFTRKTPVYGCFLLLFCGLLNCPTHYSSIGAWFLVISFLILTQSAKLLYLPIDAILEKSEIQLNKNSAVSFKVCLLQFGAFRPGHCELTALCKMWIFEVSAPQLSSLPGRSRFGSGRFGGGRAAGELVLDCQSCPVYHLDGLIVLQSWIASYPL